jgi:hypothetical protein
VKAPGNVSKYLPTYSTCLNNPEVLHLNKAAVRTSYFLLDGCIFELKKKVLYMGADKSLARPGKKQATATEDFEFHISYL